MSIKSLLKMIKNRLRGGAKQANNFSGRWEPRSSAGYRSIQYKRGRRAYLTEVENDDPDAPIFVVFHGGGWFAGSPLDNSALADFLGSWGRCYLVEYSTYALSRTTVDNAVDDAIAFADFIEREHPRRKFVSIGYSAGAVLAAWFVRTLKEQSSAMILLSGVTDIGPGGYSNCMIPQRGRSDISPLGFADLIQIPVLAIHANGDETVPISQARKFYKTLIAQKTPARLVEIDSKRHDFHRIEHFQVHVRTEILDFLYARRLVRGDYPDHARLADRRMLENLGVAGESDTSALLR